MQDRGVIPNEEGSETATSLLQAAIAADPLAWNALVQHYSARVYRWCLRARLQHTDAADATQMVFAVVSRSLPKFRHEQETGTFRGWLWKVTQSQIAQLRRLQQRQGGAALGGTDYAERAERLVAEPDPTTMSKMPPQFAAAEELALERVRQRCTEQTWAIFWQLTALNRSPAELAREFAVSESQIYVIKHRVAKRIREELATLRTETMSGSAEFK